MASIFRKRRLAVITVAYWFLLVYITAALIWWFIALQRQNVLMTDYRMQELQKEEPGNEVRKSMIAEEHKRKTAQYIGEGFTFMLVIFAGALFVYRATRNQIRLTHQQQNFMMAVTHELKTPIAVAKLNLETLLKRKLEVSQQDKLIQNTLHETDRLNDLCNNILLASQLEGGGYKLSHEKLNLSKLVKECVMQFRGRYPNRIIEAVFDNEIFLTGDEWLLKIAVNNLIENALKYSPWEKPVRVNLDQSDAEIRLQVLDEGSGVPDAEKSKVFEKFYRLGDESTRKAQGTGLGLYLTRKIAEDHKGRAEVMDNSPAGSIFMITFQNR